MAKNEQNKPDEVKTTPAQETPAKENAAPAPMPEIGGEAPAPEMTAEEAVALSHEGEAALHEIGDDTLEPPTPVDIPDPGDVVVSFDKINEIVSGKQAAVKEAEQAPPEKQGVEKSGPNHKKRSQRSPARIRERKTSRKRLTASPNPASRKPPKKRTRSPPVLPSRKNRRNLKNPPSKSNRRESAAVLFLENPQNRPNRKHRPREDGGYEIVSGHRRQMASELAGFTNMPCIVRNLTDEQAITQMVEDNTTQREAILPSERAKALQMQLEAIKSRAHEPATDSVPMRL